MSVNSWLQSLYWQGVKSGDSKGRQVSLLLAERMVSNFVKEGKIEAEAEVLTYLHILETQVNFSGLVYCGDRLISYHSHL